VQEDTHDSIEDARTALALYHKYREIRTGGDGAVVDVLLQLYEIGHATKFTVETRSDRLRLG
jgi:hypothetical protein